MAKPNPERELERLRKAVTGRKRPEVIVLMGTSEFFRREAFDLALTGVDAGAELRQIDGTQDSDGHELDDLRGAALFGAGCWLAVRRGTKWLKTNATALEAVLPQRSSGCGLLVEIDKLDKRTKLAKTLTAAGDVFEFRDLYAEPYDRSRSPLEAELVGWVVQRAARADLRITPEAAFVLITSVGQEPAEIVAEIERLASAIDDADKKRTLDPRALQPHLSTSFESTPFEFAEAVLARDRRRALRSLQAMYARGVKSRDGTGMDRGGLFPFITAWLFQSLTKVYEGRRLLESGVPARDVPGRMGVRVFVDRFQSQLTANDAGWLRHALHELQGSQRALRRTGEDPERILERFLARCLGGRHAKSEKARGGPARSGHGRGGAA